MLRSCSVLPKTADLPISNSSPKRHTTSATDMDQLFPIIIRVLVPSAFAFVIGMAITPIVTHYLYKYKAWKKRPGKVSLDGSVASEFNRLHEANEVRAPRMGGIVVWASVLLTILGIDIIAHIFQSASILRLDFLSRNQTWIPLAT